MKNTFFLIVVLFSISSFSQTVEAKKWKFAFQFDNRFSSIDKKEITIFGVKGGVQYKNLTRFGLGVSFILNPVKFEYFNKKMKVDETNNISFWYVSVFNDWIVYKDNRWECFITEQLVTAHQVL